MILGRRTLQRAGLQVTAASMAFLGKVYVIVYNRVAFSETPQVPKICPSHRMLGPRLPLSNAFYKEYVQIICSQTVSSEIGNRS